VNISASTMRRSAVSMLLLSHLAVESSGMSEEFLVSWGFEDWDFPPNRFQLKFRASVSITRIQGFVSASMLPIGPARVQHANRVRWASLKCHNGAPKPDGFSLMPKYAVAEGNVRPKKYEQELGSAAVDLELQQQDRHAIHLPVRRGL